MSWWSFGKDANGAVSAAKSPLSEVAEGHSQSHSATKSLATASNKQTETELNQLVYGMPEIEEPIGPVSKTSKDRLEEPASQKMRSVSSLAPLPATMSCRQAFDNAWYCQSPGGQFINIYRYGAARDCSAIWSQFWFCMRNRGRPEEEKKAAIQDWYQKVEQKYVTGPSSEDVWDDRKTPVARAFDWDPDAEEQSTGTAKT